MKSLLCRFKGFAHKVAWKQRLHNSELSCFTNNGIKVGLNVFIAFVFFFVRLCKKKIQNFKNVCAGLIYRLFKKIISLHVCFLENRSSASQTGMQNKRLLLSKLL